MKKMLICSLIFSMLTINAVLASDEVSEHSAEQEQKGVVEKALTPVGWAIGGAVAPVYLGADAAFESFTWTWEYVFSPFVEGVVIAASYAENTVTKAQDWTEENILDPAIDIVHTGLDYTVVPFAKGVGITGKALYDALEYGATYSIVPLAKGIAWGADKTYDYAIVPVGKGVAWGFENSLAGVAKGAELGFNYAIVPLAKGTYYGAKYTVFPVAKGAAWTAETIGGGLTTAAEYTIVPVTKGVYYGVDYTLQGVGYGLDYVGSGLAYGANYTVVPVAKGVGWTSGKIGEGVKKTVTPVKNAVKSTVNGIKSVFKHI